MIDNLVSTCNNTITSFVALIMKVTIRLWLRSSPTSSSVVTNLSPSTSLRWVKLESKQSWPSHRQPVHVNNVISWIVCVAKDPSKYKHGRILSLVSQHFSFKVQNNSFLKIWSSTISINTKLYLWGTGSQNIYHQRFFFNTLKRGPL